MEAGPLSLGTIVPPGLDVLPESMTKSSGRTVEARMGTGHPEPRGKLSLPLLWLTYCVLVRHELGT